MKTKASLENVTYEFVHPSFKLHGIHFNRLDLIQNIEVIIKEGEEFQKDLAKFIFDWFNKLPYLEVTTSGTTGKPKIIKIDKQAMVNSALATGNYFDLWPGNKVLHCLPIRFIAGKTMLVRAFILGLDVDFVKPNSRPLKYIDTKYDFAAMVPMQVQNSLEDLGNVKKIIIGGAIISQKLEKQILKLPIEAYETYGMTETITHVAARRVGEKAFTVLPNVKISTDENNCLLINAPRISKNTIVTKDIVKIVNDKQFEFLGRFDNIINSGGIKLMPELIEAKLAKYINKRFFVAGVADVLLGEKLILIVEGAHQTLDEAIFSSLDKYEKPKEVKFLEKFIETENCKILRNETLALLQ